MDEKLWNLMIHGVKTYKKFIRLAALAFWREDEMRTKCFKLERTWRNREQRELYEQEKYLAVRSK